MRPSFAILAGAAVLGALFVLSPAEEAQADDSGVYGQVGRALPVQLGPRPFYLLDKLREGALKDDLQRCAAGKTRYRPSDFSIGHRGAALQFPEHTVESYVAAARMGVGTAAPKKMIGRTPSISRVPISTPKRPRASW